MNSGSMTANKQDLFTVIASSLIPLWIEEIRLDPISSLATEYLLSMKLFTGAYTSGAGGTTITPSKNQFNDAAAGATCRITSSTQTSTSGGGTNTIMDAGNWNLVNGWAWQPIDTDHRIAIPMSGQFSLSLDTTPSSATVNGCLIFREMF